MKNNMKLLTALLASSLSFTSFAATQQMAGTFETIKAVTIDEITPLNLVGLALADNSTCTLAASTDGSGTGYVGDVTMGLASVNGNAPGADISTMSGGTCLTSATGGVIGIYEIDGAAGAEVKITIVDGLNADLSIVPSGCAGNYSPGPNGDSCDQVDALTGEVTVRLAGATDTGTLGEGTPQVGKTRIALGAIATAEQALVAGNAYTVDFEINVTY